MPGKWGLREHQGRPIQSRGNETQTPVLVQGLPTVRYMNGDGSWHQVGEAHVCLSTFVREQGNKQREAAGASPPEVTAHQLLPLKYISVTFPSVDTCGPEPACFPYLWKPPDNPGARLDPEKTRCRGLLRRVSLHYQTSPRWPSALSIFPTSAIANDPYVHS